MNEDTMIVLALGALGAVTSLAFPAGLVLVLLKKHLVGIPLLVLAGLTGLALTVALLALLGLFSVAAFAWH